MDLVALMVQNGGAGQIEEIARTFGVNWPHLVSQIISFGIVCAVLYRFAYAPVLRVLEARRQQIAQGLANTEKINAALADIETQRLKVMADAQAQATQFLADARAVAKRVQEQETQRAMAAAEQIVTKAREAAAQEHQQMLAELRQEVGRLVVQTTAAVIGRVVTPDDHQRLAEDTARYLQAS
jgi:F-type H+-transporting ATPase subunit b